MVEKLSVFYKVLRDMDNMEYFYNFISYNVALISARLKPSITLNLMRELDRDLFSLWNIYGKEYLKDLNLEYIKLRETSNSLVILIYDKELLEEYISKDENLKFLNSIGYDYNICLDKYLETLSERYNIYKCPHELGVFLGYPLDDVIDFMNCSNKKCLACGYWKVYNSSSRAKKIFNLFDEVKEVTVDNILKGNTKSILSEILRESFQENHKLVFN